MYTCDTLKVTGLSYRLFKNQMKKQHGSGQFGQVPSGCRVSARLHGQGGPNLSQSKTIKTDDAGKLPIICPYKASRGSALAGSQDEMAGRCQLRGNKAGACWLHPPPIPAWGARWAQLLGWQAGNITPGHCLLLSNGNSCYQLPVPLAFFYKTNTILDTPFFSKKRVKKGFH